LSNLAWSSESVGTPSSVEAGSCDKADAMTAFSDAAD